MKFHRKHEHEAQIRSRPHAGISESALPKVFYGYVRDREVIHALISREEWTPGDERWHISMSGPGRVPTWNEVAETIHALRPGVPFVMGVPPRSQWMNVHKDVLHAWESKDEGMIAQWRAEGRGDRPS